MPARFRSWFTEIEKAKGSYWALPRAFAKKSFGFLWWSGDGKAWTPVQAFEGTPVWLQMDDANDVMSVGFFERDLDVIAFKTPDAAQMAELVSAAPTFSFADLLRGKIFAASTP